MKKLTEGMEFLTEKRSAKTEKLRREYNRARKKSHGRKRVKYHSSVLDLLCKHNSKPIKKGTRLATIRVPSIFSIIDNPKPSIETILELSDHGRACLLKSLRINHAYVKQLDLAAESILDLTTMELDREARNTHRKFDIGGFFPKDPYLERYIRAIGIIKNLEVTHEYLSKEEESTLQIFSMRNKRLANRDSLGVSDYKERAVAEFVDHINTCLNDNGLELTHDARRMLADYTGELIGNAEDHSGTDDWTIVGYLDNEHNMHICEVAIFNLGKTISDTFLELERDSYGFQCIETYIEKHKKLNIFDHNWKEEDLLTLIALQEHISSKNRSAEDTRGQGTVAMIEFFQQIHKECTKDDKSCAKMALLSGSTHLLFDGKYQMKPNIDGRNIIAFNEENHLEKKPDASYVKNLGPTFFPGTIISIRFPMQTSQMQEARSQ